MFSCNPYNCSVFLQYGYENDAAIDYDFFPHVVQEYFSELDTTQVE